MAVLRAVSPIKSKYKYVVCIGKNSNNSKQFRAQVTMDGKIVYTKRCSSEIEAAKKVDLYLISIGKEPVNIYKKK